MLNNRVPTVALLALAGVLLSGPSARAQDYFYGYYYPNEHRFNTDNLETSGSLGFDYGGYGPSTSRGPAPWVKDAVAKREASPAVIKLFVPNSQAKVWFDGAVTTSTGTVRTFTTPPLDPGTAHHYKVKVSYSLDGRGEITQDRYVAVLPGHTAVFHFPKTAVNQAPAPAVK